MAAAKSAGLLAYRRAGAGVQFLLAHPGGPFWAKRDAGAWTIPKGLVGEGEEAHAAPCANSRRRPARRRPARSWSSSR